MSEQFSLLEIILRNAPELECRSILTSITAAHLAGLPLQPREIQLGINIQNLSKRIRGHFGEVPFGMVEPELKEHSPGHFAFPKMEHIALLFAPSTSECLAIIWYESDLEAMMSHCTRQKIAALDWKSLAKGIEAKP